MDSAGKKETKPENPRATASILSALTFSWTFYLFRLGSRRELSTSDLCEPLPEHTAHLLGNRIEEYWNEELQAYKENPKRRPNLMRIIYKMYGGKVFLYFSCFALTELITKGVQPYLMGRFIQYFAPNSTVSFYEAKMYAAGMVSCQALNLAVVPPCWLALMHIGMKVRVCVCSLIYRKSLRLSQEAKSKIGAGHIVNVLSNDASRLDRAFAYMPNFFIGPAVTMLVSCVLWWEAGVIALIGVAILVLLVPLQAVLGKKTASLRRRIAVKTDQRIRLMNEIIGGIQVIKMYAWEKSFAKLVGLARRKEATVIREKMFTVGSLNAATAFSTKLAMYVSLLVYASYGHVIRAHAVFVMVLCYTVIEDKLIIFFPLTISTFSELYVSLKRMNDFMMSKEVNDITVEKVPSKIADGEIDMTNVCARWTTENADTLKNITVRIQPGSLVAIIGPVGSGKSSFLQLVLRELHVKSGKVKVGGTLSYAAQEPWLFGGTVRQNILFGLAMDKEKYQMVVRVCALEPDLEQFPNGDETIIGERGICLSGGQKARVNLARAIYRDADIYLLDDPLSSVDSQVNKHLFEECICGYLAGKTVVLVTHQVQRLNNVNHVIKMDGGEVVAQGALEEISDTEIDLASADGATGSEDQGNVTMSIKNVPSREDIPRDAEMRSSGNVNASVYFAYLKGVKSVTLVVSVVVTFILFAVTTSGSHYWLSFWVNKEEHVFPNTDHITVPLLGELNRSFCMSVYVILVGALIIISVIRTILHAIMSTRASTNLHNTLFTSISKASLNFFHNTPSGQILNRFSRDTNIIDEDLPVTLCNCARVGLQVLGSFVLIFTVNWYLMIPFVLIVLILYKLRQYYIVTSRSIKRVEAIARSPIYTHVNASMQGLTTIRSMSAESRLHQEFDHTLDTHSSAWFYVLGTDRAFSYYLDIVCCIYIAVVTFSFLVLDSQFLGGDVGLAITQSISITLIFQWVIRQTAEVVNQMTAVERVYELSKVVPESEDPDFAPDPKLLGWPFRGAVEFSDVSLSYDPTGTPVLQNVNFEIRPGEKIGVVGRTGAGKSSLVAALFRLHKVDGKIIIDGIETGSIGLQDLRSKISIIPQDPVIFSGTMRFNLDPFDDYEDLDLWNALEAVELKSVIQSSPGGLLTNLAEGGVNLSVGQRQLVCLARAILRNSKVLILDEATANVDAETDDFIQAAIRKRFAHCTVITIAHRLHTVMDSDRILVMDNGRVVEFGPPHVLLLDPKGYFTHLLELTGPRSNICCSSTK